MGSMDTLVDSLRNVIQEQVSITVREELAVAIGRIKDDDTENQRIKADLYKQGTPHWLEEKCFDKYKGIGFTLDQDAYNEENIQNIKLNNQRYFPFVGIVRNILILCREKCSIDFDKNIVDNLDIKRNIADFGPTPIFTKDKGKAESINQAQKNNWYFLLAGTDIWMNSDYGPSVLVKNHLQQVFEHLTYKPEVIIFDKK